MANSLDHVISGGYCIGCGACGALPGSPYEIDLDESGRFQAELRQGALISPADYDVERVCPFSDSALTEDEIGQEVFSQARSHDDSIGFYESIYAGYVEEGEYRAHGSSGGIGKWILAELLRKGHIDSVIQVSSEVANQTGQVLYQYCVVSDPDEVIHGSKSVYYPTELSNVLKHVRDTPGRYAITGIPCFIKALRLLMKEDAVYADRIKFCIGLICGHAKSTKYAEMLAWQFGVEAKDLNHIDFRKKIVGATAKEKGVQVSSRVSDQADIEPRRVQDLFGADYNLGLFQYKACDYCDDVVAETADISVGDAWLPEYISDGLGTSVLIVRNRVIGDLIDAALSEGRIRLDIITPDRVVESQKGGYRQRKEGLAYRLYLADKKREWRPRKRVAANNWHVSGRKKIYSQRQKLTEESFVSFASAQEQGEIKLFEDELRPMIEQYYDLYKPTFMRGLYNGVQRRLRKWIPGLTSPR